MEDRQSSLNARGGLEWMYPVLLQGKVIGVHTGGQHVDIAFLSGGTARQVPVLFGMAGTFFGFSNLIAPTVDPLALAATTYLNPNPDDLQGAYNSEFMESNLDGKNNRDIWACCLPCNGPLVGTAGMFVIGFYYPQSNEMQLPSDPLLSEFSDSVTLRLPSDLQITVDGHSNLSIQQPNGARLTLGGTSAFDGTEVIDTPVDLTGKDLNGLYQIRNNKGVAGGVMLQDSSKSALRMNANQDVALSNTTPASVHLDAEGRVTITDKAGSTAILDGAGNIVFTCSGDATVNAKGNANVNAANATITVTGIITLIAGALVKVLGALITLN